MQAHAIKPGESLLAEEAFKFKAEVIAPDKIKATWDIADGHYLSRKRFQFETSTPDVTLDSPLYPQADAKNDPILGQVEIYHHKVEIEIPLKRGQTATQAVDLALNIKYQGCSDAGICFPPQKQTATLQLSAVDQAPTPAQAEAKPEAPATTSNAALPDLIKQAQKPTAGSALPVDKAFAFDMVAIDKGTLNARWVVQPDHHLYRPKIKFTVKEPQGITLGTPLFPAGETVKDEYFGEIEVYGKDFDVQVPILQATGLQKLVVETEYQGCSDKTGVCYPPVTQTRELTLTGLPDAKPLANSEAAVTQAPLNKQDALTQRLEDSSLLQIIAITFGLGLLLAFTPCIFPMIPILSGIIAGYGNTSSRKALWLSVTYVVSGAVAYAIIGFVFGYFGQNLQAVLQHPIAVGLMSALFVALAFSMFGFYDLQLPNSLQSRLNEISNKQESGSFVGAAIMGFLSTLIVGPCAGPAIAGILTFITQSHNAWLGAAALFSLGMGIGVPLILIGTSAGHLLPRAGVWMDTVKALFGMIMLGVAIYMLSRIVSIEITMALTGILLVSSGVYMGALESIDEDAGGWGRFWKSTGMLQLFYGALILLGLSAGSTNLMQPLKGIFSVGMANTQPTETITFQRIKGIEGLEAALQQAKAQKRPVMLDFYADWCSYCQTMERTTFKDSATIKAFGNTLFLQTDVTASNEQNLNLQNRFNIPAPPAIVFFNDAGEELRPMRLIGNVTPEQLRSHAATFMQQAVK